tara:strand:+ start:184 stop:366 length:183 start_codon:yes stop_codon:yes gene_type:complete
MDISKDISEKIKLEEIILLSINETKQTARSVDASRNVLLAFEKQKSYIEGLKAALVIIES